MRSEAVRLLRELLNSEFDGSQSRMARDMRIDRSSLNRWLSCRTQPSTAAQFRACQRYGIDLESWLTPALANCGEQHSSVPYIQVA